MTSKFSSKKPLSPSQLKEFRSAVASLKRQGLLKGSVDARSARPYFVRGGKTLAEQVNKNLDKIQPVNRSTKTVGRTSRAKLQPKAPELKPLNTPISVRDYPLNARGLASTIKGLDENFAEINKLKRPREKFGFEIDGIRSYAIFYDIRDLAEYLSESAGIQMVLKRRQQSAELFSKLKLVRWNRTAKEWKPGPQKLTKTQAERRKKRRKQKR